MKKAVLLILFFANGFKGFGQEIHTVGVFRSFPTGKFGSSNLGSGGFAKSGWGFLLENNTKPKIFPRGFSFATRFSYQKNEIDTPRMASKFSQALGHKTRISDSAYEPITLLAGPNLEIALRERLFLQLKFGAGVMFTKVNAFRIEVFDGQGNVLFEDVLDATGNVPFAYLGGVQLRQAITKKFSVNIFADYTSAKGKMGAKLGKVRTTPSEFDMATLNTGLSLKFEFN